MSYTYAPLAQAISDLASRLSAQIGNPLQAFWSSAELQAYLNEALMTWNALTSFWRADMVFPIRQNQTWYDLPSQVNSPRPYTVTDQLILEQIEYHLLEPLTAAYPLVWGGSKQFDLQSILGAIQRRRDEVLGATDCTINVTMVNAPFVQRIPLPENVIDLRRVLWVPNSYDGTSLYAMFDWTDFTITWQTLPDNRLLNSVLFPSDDFSDECYSVGDSTAPQQPPTTFKQSAQPPITFETDYIPPLAGLYECLTVNSGPALTTTAPTLLGVPDDWAWVIKWGALADLFGREINAKDALRQKYCEQRFTEMVGLMFTTPAVLAARINNIPVFADSIRNGDDFDVLWESVSGPPQIAYIAGLNLVGFGPIPDLPDAYSATLRVVENAPLPVAATDYIQLSPDDYDAILSESQHLACFKMGGAEFVATIPLHQVFLTRAAVYNAKLLAMGQYQKTQAELSQLEQERNPVYASESADG